MRKQKTIELKGIIFEVQKAIDDRLYYSGRDLYDCYNKPSYAKQNIYEWWKNWYYDNFDYENRIGNLTVHSYNCNMFTLTMGIIYNGKQYHLYITPSHNYISEVK